VLTGRKNFYKDIMEKCVVTIETPVKYELIFTFECDSRDVRYSICDSSGFIKLSGPLGIISPHHIDVSALKSGSYNLKLLDGDVWGDNKFEIAW
jgi:hypothetical protein